MAIGGAICFLSAIASLLRNVGPQKNLQELKPLRGKDATLREKSR
jgi:hypothetical protein